MVRPSVRRLAWVFAGVAWGCSGADVTPLPSLGGAGETPGAESCEDRDGDGYGFACALGTDCDDADGAVTDECRRCLTPQEGCPCDAEGQVAQCGQRVAVHDDYVSCVKGERVCDGAAWGPCNLAEGDTYRVLTATRSVHALGGVVNGCDDACDPQCQGLSVEPAIISGGGLRTNPDGSVTGAPGGTVTQPGGVCAGETAKALKTKYGIVMMLDSSGSMEEGQVCLRSHEECGFFGLICWDECDQWGATRWETVHQPLKDFVNSPDLGDSAVGLEFFPEGGECGASRYRDLDVAVADISAAQRTALINRIDSEGMGGGTPLLDALAGAIDAANDWMKQGATPGFTTDGRPKKGIALLMTDGEPDNDCPLYPDEEKAAAVAKALDAYQRKGIETFVIGMASEGVDLSYLNQIARAGSGNKRDAFIISAGSGSGAVTDALRAISGGLVSCDFGMPQPSKGVIDPFATTLAIKAGGKSRELGMVSTAGDCGAGDGAYYDVVTGRITLCPTSCSFAQSDPNAEVDIKFSCQPSCTQQSAEAKPGPIDLFVMMDRSGSMWATAEYPYRTGGWLGTPGYYTRWEAVRDALWTFANSSSAAGVGMGMGYFPVPLCDRCASSSGKKKGYPNCSQYLAGASYCASALTDGGFGDSTNSDFYGEYAQRYIPWFGWVDLCAESDYRNPASPGWVSIAPIDANQRTILQRSLFNVEPEGGTPTLPALQGAIEYMKPRRTTFPERQGAVVLATDGQPNSDCDDDTTKIANAAASGRAAGVPTYVIGVGDSGLKGNLDKFAQAGSGTNAIMVNGGDASAFVSAMTTIRKSIENCTLEVPEAPPGGYTLEKTRVVRQETASGKQTDFVQVKDAGACGTTTYGWYFKYKVGGDPEFIQLCPASCAFARASAGRTNVIFQCPEGKKEGTATYAYDSADVSCPLGSRPLWADWSWKTSTPGASKVEFLVATSNTAGVFTTWVPLRFTGTRFLGEPVCASRAGVCSQKLTTDTQFGGPLYAQLPGDVLVDTVLRNAGQVPGRYVSVQAILKTDGQANAPIFGKPEMRLTCQEYQ